MSPDINELSIIQKLLEMGATNPTILILGIGLTVFYTIKTIISGIVRAYTSLVKPSDIKELNNEIKCIAADVQNLKVIVNKFNEKTTDLSMQIAKNDNMSERNRDYISSLKTEVSNVQTLLEILKIKVDK